MKAVVSEKGQVTIPKKLRDRMGIRAGQTVDFEEVDGGRRLMLRKADEDNYLARIGSLRGVLKQAFPELKTDQIVEELRGSILPDELPE